MPSGAGLYEPTGLLIDAGFDLDETLALREQCKKAIEKGLIRVSEWADEGQSAKRYYELSTLQLLVEVKFALAVLKPDEFGQNLLPRKTTARFL